MATRRVWVLNLDAEVELAARGPYTRSRAMGNAIGELVPRIQGLVRLEDRVLGRDELAATDDHQGRCWCPTPTALASLQRAGIGVPDAPSLDVLRKVNHRGFGFGLAEPLPGACMVHGMDQACETLARAPAGTTGQWLAKRVHSFAGRGQRRIPRGALDPAAAAFVARSLADDGALLLEPWVERDADFSIHGLLLRDGGLRLGAPVQQLVDARGSWQRTRAPGEADLAPDEAATLAEHAERAAAALHAAHYFGPFGIDAFRYRQAAARLRLQPCVELNARYCMGWAVGMGDADGSRATYHSPR